ncbi:LytS family sensor histidine kinase [Sphingobacterium bovistauri]|uniref:Signal transduction histidine kinase internal region domain-containing protein n=1 Tax=Sphingobacterium bovistauri TaxID=2781959 RepID=A0ABS7Z5P7_9SPHI|nr:hypothetical protein [Sphingobacterium bovistauri]MCA5005511.1 hypothetical protein [Sphingobacterium bovistauri]
MANFLNNIFGKAPIVDTDKLNLQAQLSVQSCMLDLNLIRIAVEQKKIVLLQDFFSLTTRVDINKQYSLNKELDLLNSYISSYKSASQSEFFIKVSNTVEKESLIQVFPFILLPLIQNAIINGYNSMENYPIRINIMASTNSLKLEVSNRVNHYIQSQESTTVIENLKARLTLLYPERHQLLINSNSNIFKTTLLLG